MDELKEIILRQERGYTMAIYGTRDAIHTQMDNDISLLIELVKDAYNSGFDYAIAKW